MSSEILKITCSDGKVFEVDIKLKNASRIICDVLADSDDPDIPLPEIDSQIFIKILEYLEIHQYNPPDTQKPIQSGNLKNNIDPKDYLFIKDYDLNTIKPLFNAALYLGIKQLEELCAATIATYFYFDGTQQGFNLNKKKLGINADLNVKKQKEIEELQHKYFD